MDKIGAVPITLGLILSTTLDTACAHPPKPAEPIPQVSTPATIDNIQSTPLDPDIMPQGPRAFPEAAGWAAFTPGGRGGKILPVTTLAADGPGSLTDAIHQPGPRIVVFEVAGIIDFHGRSIKIQNPYLTIAGQTAPSPGITIIKGGLSIATHDVVIRHLRIRPGEAAFKKGSGWEVDGLNSSAGAENLIVDHCSFSWATDENLTASGPRFAGEDTVKWRQGTSHRVTFSHNIVAEGLSRSTHSKGEHSKGTLVHDNVTRIAILGNLFLSNLERNPLFKGGAHGIVVNNYIHNPGATGIQYGLVADEWEGHPFEIGALAVVGNVMTYGPSTQGNPPLVFVAGPGPCRIYLAGNIAKDRKGVDCPMIGSALVKTILLENKPPLWPAGYTPMPALQVRRHIEQNVGARPWDRDAVDMRLIREILSGEGKIIDSETEGGGYPVAHETHQKFNPTEWDLSTMERKR